MERLHLPRAGAVLFFVASGWGALSVSPAAFAQDNADNAGLQSVTVVGSRIKSSDVQGQAPVLTIDRAELERAGITSVGEILQQLPSAGSALNSKFNSSGNFGYPADAGGIGAGSAQVDLRNLGAKRVLVLVDGLRWVNESSASGVSTVVDLNTIPLSIIERVEVLEDGASALYGSDAIAGVVNIITRRDFDGAETNLYLGGYDEGDGQTKRADISVGGRGERFSMFVSASYNDQDEIEASDREQSQFPVPGTGLTRGSSATPQGRVIFTDPRTGRSVNMTLNDGTATPFYDPANPTGGASTYHPFTVNDRFNFAPYNYILTPSERKGLFAQFRYELSSNTQWYFKGLYNTRESLNRAAPEPIFLGAEAGTGGLGDTVSISALNPYNPFGIDLIAGQNFDVLTRRPLEGGPRRYRQSVDTYYFATGFDGNFSLKDRDFSWDLNLVDSRNRADQTATGNYNVRHIQQALGDPAQCQAPCVPLNLFGGMGANGQGTITREMLDWIQYDGTDKSENTLQLASLNISGPLFDIWAGPLAFAAGVERREYDGFFQPDSLKISGESNDVLAQATSGSYEVDEVYVEFSIPLLRDLPALQKLDLSIAGRHSDYSTFGGEETFKAGLRWQVNDDLIIRGTVAEGFRAPAIGELFGARTRFDATITDPCSNFNNSSNPTIAANCRRLGIPENFEQLNSQISVQTGGNRELEPESADSLSAGFVYTPGWGQDASWAQRSSLEVTYYDHEIDSAIQAPDAQNQLNLCVQTLSPEFCTGITRTPGGNIQRFENQLTNLGSIETNGFDVKLSWSAPLTDFGGFTVSWLNTFVSKYEAIGASGAPEPRAEGVEFNDSAIPEWSSVLNVDWTLRDFGAGFTVRYIDSVTEQCTDDSDNSPNSLTNLGLCSNPNFADNSLSLNELDATAYLDVRGTWTAPLGVEGLQLGVGLNNALDEDPPVCISCSLNGYDPSTYDAPGRFWYVRAGYKF